jgi:hypothetical protein
VAAALVSWDHSGGYPLPNAWLSSGTAGFTKTFKLDDPEHAFIADHNVDGRILMPVRRTFWRHIQHFNYKFSLKISGFRIWVAHGRPQR